MEMSFYAASTVKSLDLQLAHLNTSNSLYIDNMTWSTLFGVQLVK